MFFPTYQDLRAVCYNSNLRVSPWAYLIFSSNAYRQLLAGSILLYADAPFLKSNANYELLRTTKVLSYWSKIFYVLILAVSYYLIGFAISLLCLIPNVYFTFEWGRLITLVVSNPEIAAFGGIGWLSLGKDLIGSYRPLEVLGINTAIHLLEYIIVGFIIFFFANLFRQKNNAIGALVAFFWSLFPEFILAFGDDTWIKFFPSTWMMTYQLNFRNIAYHPFPGISEAIIYLAIIAAGLLIACRISYEKQDFSQIEKF